MRSRPALVQNDPAAEYTSPTIRGVLRLLMEFAETHNCGGAIHPSGGNSAEEILLDTEVDGSRYLLLRMSKPDRNGVQLSPREQEIVRMVAKGHPNKVIADVLNISSWTVCTHLRRIFAKLGVGSRAAMVAQLLELGVLHPEHHDRASVR